MSLDVVGDMLRAPDLDFHAHPPIPAIGLRRRVRAVAGHHRAFHEDFRAGRADVGRRSRAALPAAEQLGLDGNGKILILAHRLRRLTVQHQPVVAQRPRRRARYLLTDEPVLGRHDVVGELPAVEQMPEVVVERLVFVVRGFEESVLDTKRVVVVDAEIEAGDLRDPAVEILPVEKLQPFRRRRSGRRRHLIRRRLLRRSAVGRQADHHDDADEDWNRHALR